MAKTLAALSKTSKGMLNYKTHMELLDGGTPFPKTSQIDSTVSVEESVRRLTLQDVQSILDGT